MFILDTLSHFYFASFANEYFSFLLIIGRFTENDDVYIAKGDHNLYNQITYIGTVYTTVFHTNTFD